MPPPPAPPPLFNIPVEGRPYCDGARRRSSSAPPRPSLVLSVGFFTVGYHSILSFLSLCNRRVPSVSLKRCSLAMRSPLNDGRENLKVENLCLRLHYGMGGNVAKGIEFFACCLNCVLLPSDSSVGFYAAWKRPERRRPPTRPIVFIVALHILPNVEMTVDV